MKWRGRCLIKASRTASAVFYLISICSSKNKFGEFGRREETEEVFAPLFEINPLGPSPFKRAKRPLIRLELKANCAAASLGLIRPFSSLPSTSNLLNSFSDIVSNSPTFPPDYRSLYAEISIGEKAEI